MVNYNSPAQKFNLHNYIYFLFIPLQFDKKLLISAFSGNVDRDSCTLDGVEIKAGVLIREVSENNTIPHDLGETLCFVSIEHFLAYIISYII